MATPIPANTCAFTLGEIARATGGRISGGLAHTALRGISIDSRTIAPSALFVALRGEIHDGHAFLADAARSGAAAVMVDHGRASIPAISIPSIEVPDTLAALGSLARAHLDREREARPLPGVAVAGSAGKTTSREIIAALAGALFGPVLSTPGNLNNLIGVPMTLFTLTRKHRATVIECGTNRRGEIGRLGAIVRPDVALLINVDIEHSEGLGTVDEIADEETSIFRFTTHTAIAPAGDARILARIPSHLRTITFGHAGDSHVRLAQRSIASSGRAKIRIELARAMVEPGVAGSIEAEIGLLGAASALNAAAAVACAATIWPKPLGEAELNGIRGALRSITPVPGRLSTAVAGGIIIIDDSYNSNPASARAALEAASEMAAGLRTRLIIAMGDMLELGELSAESHAELVAEIGRLHPAAFIAVGANMASACRGAGSAAAAPGAMLAASSDEAAPLVCAIARAGDVVLVKGSRGIRMERVVEALTRR